MSVCVCVCVCVCACECVHVKAVVGFEPMHCTVQFRKKCHLWGLNLCIEQCSYLRKKEKNLTVGFESVPT